MRLKSGCIQLDIALGGGLPRGGIVELYGPEASGKTTLALHAIAAVQAAGGEAAFVDVEQSLDGGYAERIGVDVSMLGCEQPGTAEEAFGLVETFLRDLCPKSGGAGNLIVIDSVAALALEREFRESIGDDYNWTRRSEDYAQHSNGTLRQIMSRKLRKIKEWAKRGDCTVMFTNQLRETDFAVTTVGGPALRSYADVRLEMSAPTKADWLRRTGEEEPYGIRLKVTVVKNRSTPSDRKESAEMDLIFSQGLSAEGDLFDAAMACGLLGKKGSWYYYGELRLGQGRDRAGRTLSESPEVRRSLEVDLERRMKGAREGVAGC